MSKKYIIIRNTYDKLENGYTVCIPEIMFDLGYGDSYEEAKAALSKHIDRIMVAEDDRVSREVSWMKEMSEQILLAIDYQESTIDVLDVIENGKAVILADNPRARKRYPQGIDEWFIKTKDALGLRSNHVYLKSGGSYMGIKVRKEDIVGACEKILADNWECPIKPTPRESFEGQFSIIPISKTKDVAG